MLDVLVGCGTLAVDQFLGRVLSALLPSLSSFRRLYRLLIRIGVVQLVVFGGVWLLLVRQLNRMTHQYTWMA